VVLVKVNIYILSSFLKIDVVLVVDKRRRTPRRRQSEEKSSYISCQQYVELLTKLDELSAHVQYNTDQINKVHRRIDTCDEQISIHQEQVDELNSLEGERHAVRDALNDAFGCIRTGGSLVQSILRKQRHIYE
jgi:chromosome segregation ATPase